jgi:hypothetical protein
MDFCLHGIVRVQVVGREEGLQISRVVANVLNKRSPATDKGWYTRLGGWAKCSLFFIVES